MQDSWITPVGTPDQDRKSASNSSSPHNRHNVLQFIQNMTIGKDLQNETAKQNNNIKVSLSYRGQLA